MFNNIRLHSQAIQSTVVKNLFVFALCGGLVFTTLTGTAQAANTLTPEQKLGDLDQLVALTKAGYGPLRYKKDKFNIDVDLLRAQYVPIIQSTNTNRDFYYSLVRFIAEFHDGHFRANLQTDLKASVPFDTDLVEGKVLIDKINRELLPEKDFSFVKGDEIVSINGQDIQAVLDDIQSYRGLGFSKSERHLAAMAVSVRSGRRMPVPTGDVTFQIRRGTSSVVEEAQLTWKIEGTDVDELEDAHSLRLDRKAFSAQTNYDELSISSLMAEVQNPNVERSYSCSGESRIEMPKEATSIMEKPFVAYYSPTPKGNVGYLRLPHYSPEDQKYDEYFSHYEYAVSELEKNTVGLVIDQDHNCGGSVEYLHRILSLFMLTPFQPMQFELLANKQEYLHFGEWVKEIPENTLARANVERVQKLIKDSWLNGEYMTPMTSIDGVDLMPPNIVHYTKPIVVLIDEMSGSGGDAFPAMIKGLGRAKLIGTRTMGLGGHVTRQPALLYSQIVAEMTKSLFYRPDGVPVENNGAEPDYNYTITRDDFIYGYHDYREFYTARLLEQL